MDDKQVGELWSRVAHTKALWEQGQLVPDWWINDCTALIRKLVEERKWKLLLLHLHHLPTIEQEKTAESQAIRDFGILESEWNQK